MQFQPTGGQKSQFLGAFQNGAFIGRVMGQSSLGFEKKVPRLPRGENSGMEQNFAGMKHGYLQRTACRLSHGQI